MIEWYTTQAGIIAATAIVVSVLKRVLGNVPYVNTIPTWAFAVSVAGTLTVLSVHFWHTLPGALWPMVSQTAISAGASSGFYEWVNRPTVSLAASAIKVGVPVEPTNRPTRDVAVVSEVPVPPGTKV